MLGNIIGAAIGAGGALLGGKISNKNNARLQNEMWNRNYQAQKEFAQNSIQWRVQDAKKAGIHPLYAMGNTPGYTPQDSGYSDAVGGAVSRASNRIADAMGQLNIANLKADLESKKLDNKAKQVELANKVASGSLGQSPKTVDLKTPVIDGVYSGKVVTSPSGGYTILPEDNVSIEDVSHFSQLYDYRYSPEAKLAHDRLAKATGKDSVKTPLGYQVKPKSDDWVHQLVKDFATHDVPVYEMPFRYMLRGAYHYGKALKNSIRDRVLKWRRATGRDR